MPDRPPIWGHVAKRPIPADEADRRTQRRQDVLNAIDEWEHGQDDDDAVPQTLP